MNEITNLGHERDIKNTRPMPIPIKKAHQIGDSSPQPIANEPDIEDLTVSISGEARLLSSENDGKARTSKGNVLPDYLKPPPKGYTQSPSAASGYTFYFLTSRDRETIYAAFDHAVENGLDTEEVGLAAFYLANQRNVEALIASGVKYVVFDPELHSDSPISESGNSIAHKNAWADLTERAMSGELFSNNPVLNQPLFITALFNALRLSDAALENRIANIQKDVFN